MLILVGFAVGVTGITAIYRKVTTRSTPNLETPLVIPRNELPEDAADWRTVNVSFPRLPRDTPESCPNSVARIMEYVRMESADLDDADPARFAFVRTAQVGDARYWLWTYTESDGQLDYVIFERRANGQEVLGLSESNGLSPEQYMLATYYNEIYWP